MNIGIYSDNTFPLTIALLVEKLNKICTTVSFTANRSNIRLKTPYLSAPSIHQSIFKSQKDMKKNDLNILITMIPYEDNFFFYSYENLYVVSFFGWNILTELPTSNGLVYFLSVIIADYLEIGRRHSKNTGCLNDFLENKTGIDIGMRTAYLCNSCERKIRSRAKFQEPILTDLFNILNFLSHASRANLDVNEINTIPFTNNNDVFDLFLCHNSQEKNEIRKINTELKKNSIKTWFDEEQLPLGMPWQPELEKQIQSIRNAAVFVGESGMGPWQNVEIRAFLSEFIRRGCPVIPVILPNAKTTPELPLFLQQMMWVDLRENISNKMTRLIASVRKSK